MIFLLHFVQPAFLLNIRRESVKGAVSVVRIDETPLQLYLIYCNVASTLVAGSLEEIWAKDRSPMAIISAAPEA